MARVNKVKSARSTSGKARTREWSSSPTLFSENRQPDSDYLAIPKVSSEKRDILPMGFVSTHVIASGSVLVMPKATLAHFGVLQSQMHMAWMRLSAGRMKSDYQYSVGIVYNNFPWPKLPEPPAAAEATRPTPAQAASQKKRAAIEAAAQAVLDARANFPEASLADLYDPLAMPPALRKAHQQLDKAVDAAYAYKGQTDDASRVAFLFGLYERMSSALAAQTVPRSKRLPAESSGVLGKTQAA